MDKQKKKKILFIGLGTAATGILGFFGWEWWKGQKDKKQQQQLQQSETAVSTNNAAGNNNSSDTTRSRSSYSLPSSSGSSDFPLHKGSRGSHVKALQQALIAKYGSSILPRYGADGSFGNEMLAALQKAGLPSSVDERTFYSVVGGGSNNNGGGSPGGSFDPTSVANSLFNAVQNSDFSTALSILRKINDTNQYAAADAVYKTLAPFLGVRKTIVTGVFDAFGDSSQQQQITSEFLRMGLKNNSGRWSLSGIEQNPLVVADADTEVFEKNGTSHSVPAGTTLGYPFAIKEGWVYFYAINAPILMKVKQEKVTIHKPNN